ncbi:MAG: riboflavin synthase [Humidesulfovibrio sp.]|jgi:riboflavin synthase|uniref:riboflavin synthase n=1 Tax=Humidesulfovibrio sp. TaxID=2910988 RepID=UPI00273339E1|nr:riboflavin synthase [Humidesulfovibrio sp.]MDP2847618.1 riboflavin synthase [Humidesulfovibrio sp.]
MFTGLVQGMGRVEAVEARGAETRLRIRALFDLKNIVLGESIAVNGTCLTVETAGDGWYTAYASAETLRHTNLGGLKSGSVVNLERALALGDRLGGHLVSGHVDCLATVAEVKPAGESRVYTLNFPAEHGAFVIQKGSVTLDGISLTVNDCGPDFLSVNIIPSTQRDTTISGWTPGTSVNMETDLIGKYVRNMLGAWMGSGNGVGKPSSKLSMDFLKDHGF